MMMCELTEMCLHLISVEVSLRKTDIQINALTLINLFNTMLHDIGYSIEYTNTFNPVT